MATANEVKITSKDLPVNIQETYTNFPKLLTEKRKSLLDEQIAETLLEIEANERNISVEKLYRNRSFSQSSDSDRKNR